MRTWLFELDDIFYLVLARDEKWASRGLAAARQTWLFELDDIFYLVLVRDEE